MSARRILITGAFGKVGTALTTLPGDKVLLDLQVPSHSLSNVFQGAVQDRSMLERAVEGCTHVVHLAASPQVESSWQAVLENNIEPMHILLDVARRAGVESIVFASSNHVVGMVELENAPAIYEPGHGVMLTKQTETRPDSFYGVSKVFGENLGRYYAENGGPRFYALRIGAVHAEDEDHPYAEAETAVRSGACNRGDQIYQLKVKRQKSLWLSRRDLLQLVQRCLDYKDERFDIFYGISNNPSRWLDIDYARERLGYIPQDNAAEWQAAPAGERI